MLFTKKEKIITKQIKILQESIIGKTYKVEKMQRFVRTTYSVLFIPIFTVDKVL